MLRLVEVMDPAIHPDGQRVAYVAVHPDEAIDGYRCELVVAARGGSLHDRWLVTDTGQSRAPQWSPDGLQLAFLSRRAGRPSQVLAVSAAGGEPEAVTNLLRGVQAFRWSPDGRELVLVAPTDAPWAAAPPGPPPPRVIERMPYRMNGRGFTSGEASHLYRLTLATDQLHPISGTLDYDASDPAWSPDGRAVAFVSARHPDHGQDLRRDVFVADLNTGCVQQRSDGRGRASSPAWSPDGRWLAYMTTEHVDSMPAHRRLFVVGADDGEHPVRLGRELDRTLAGSQVAWDPAGDRVWALVEDDGRVELFAFSGDGVQAVAVAEESRALASFDVSGDGHWAAAVVSSPTRPPEIWELDLSGSGSPRAVTAFNEAWRQEVRLVDMELFRARSAGGATVTYWKMPPTSAGAESGRRPSLLKIHGGPYVQYSYAFSHEMQFWCSQGYTVLMGNPRGSSGRGEEWARCLGERRGDLDYADLLAILDDAERRDPALDPQRVAVTGGSYGGYLTNWLVSHTTRFRAACAEAGPTNLYSMSGTGDMAGVNRRFQYGFTAQERPDFFWDRSPIAHVQHIVTPLLLLHGEEDLRVPIEQAEQLFAALYFLHRPVRMIRFPGSHHGLARQGRPSYRQYRLAAMRDWFKTFGV